MKSLLKKFFFIFAVILLPFLFAGCVSLITPLEKNSEGYYSGHYKGCGPKALAKAFAEYNSRRGIVNVRAITPEEISKRIQDDGNFVRELFAICDEDAVWLTLPREMKKVAKEYGYELISAKEFETLDFEKDVAIILVRGKFFSKEYHWACYPVDIDIIRSCYGENTKIVNIYLMKKIK